MTEKPHHILVVLAIGLAFEGMLISAASGFTLGRPFVNAAASAVLLACGIMGALGSRVPWLGLAGYLLGLAATGIIGLNIMRLALKWQATWGWMSIPALHSAIGVAACAAAIVVLWRQWPVGKASQARLPALRITAIVLAAVATVGAWFAFKGAVLPRFAAGDTTARQTLKHASPAATTTPTTIQTKPSRATRTADAASADDNAPGFDPGPVVILSTPTVPRAREDESSMPMPEGPILIFDAPRSGPSMPTRTPPTPRSRSRSTLEDAADAFHAEFARPRGYPFLDESGTSGALFPFWAPTIAPDLGAWSSPPDRTGSVRGPDSERLDWRVVVERQNALLQHRVWAERSAAPVRPR